MYKNDGKNLASFRQGKDMKCVELPTSGCQGQQGIHYYQALWQIDCKDYI